MCMFTSASAHTPDNQFAYYKCTLHAMHVKCYMCRSLLSVLHLNELLLEFALTTVCITYLEFTPHFSVCVMP